MSIESADPLFNPPLGRNASQDSLEQGGYVASKGNMGF